MGFAGISPGSLLLILAILLLVLGGKRVRNLGEDLGKAVKSFKKGMKDAELTTETTKIEHKEQS